MNLLQELEPFNSILDDFEKLKACSDKPAIEKIAAIWDRFAPTRSKEIYGQPNYTPPKTNLGCASCIQDMLKLTVNWRRILRNAPPKVDFKGVTPTSKANVKEVTVVVDKTTTIKNPPNTITTIVPPSRVTIDASRKVNYSTWKMGDLRTAAKAKGLKFTNSVSKVELIKMLSE